MDGFVKMVIGVVLSIGLAFGAADVSAMGGGGGGQSNRANP